MQTSASSSVANDPHGHGATSPWTIPPRGWWDVLRRAWAEAGQDNVSLIASGVAFCGILAMVPMLGAVVLSYGLFATPETVLHNVRALTEVMPADAARLIGEQLAGLVTSSDGKKGFGLILALGIALYGAMKGATAMMTALNIAYDEEETRGFVKLNLLALAITIGAVTLAILAVVAIAAMAALQALFPEVPWFLLMAGKVAFYALMAAAGAGAATALYRYGPDRRRARWMWLSPGSLLATIVWLAMTIGFGLYVANFGSYDATYGSLGAAIVLLIWLYLSAYILLLGAEVNCELERQTVRDTTHGHERPMGARGAFAADTVADGPEASSPPSEGLTDSPHAAAGGGQVDPAAIVRDYAAGRITARVAGTGGGGVVGTLPVVLATGGLAMLRRPGGLRTGVMLLAAGGGLCWLTRPAPAAAETPA